MAAKRRLPVLQPKEAGEERPPWQWIGIGGLLTIALWLPLSMLAGVVAARIFARYVPGNDEASTLAAYEALPPGKRMLLGALMVVGPLVALSVAALTSGLVVGRFGGRAGKREAALGGLLAATLAVVASAPNMLVEAGALDWLLTSAVVLGVAALTGYLSGAGGEKLRRRG